MKILHIIDNLSLGGAQFMVKGFVEFRTDKENHYIFSLRKSDHLIEINHPNLTLSASTNRYSLFPLFELRDIIRQKKINVMHCYLQKSQLLAWLVKKFFFPDIKLVFHELGAIASSKSIVYKLYMNKAKPLVNIYLAASQGTKKMLIDKIGIAPDKIVALYNFIVTDNFNKNKLAINATEERKKYHIDDTTSTIGFVGRLYKVKGCKYLIKAIPFVKSKIKVLIAGIGQEQENLLRIVADNNLHDKVVFLGFVKDIVNLYGLIDILIIPSEHESFGLIAIESQAMGVPVIASNIPGLNEVVLDKKNGLLFRVKDPKDLAAKIDILLQNNELRNSLINKGYENAKKYSIESYNQKLSEIYEQLE